MRTTITTVLVLMLVAGLVSGASARRPAATPPQLVPRVHDAGAVAHPARDADTLWIFDADFEDLEGDNAGWQTFDMSGTPGAAGDYWHKDTIRITEPYLGDSTWWCGTYCSWWIQPRGYGNNWAQWLYRHVTLSDWSEEGDAVTLEWDQRYALENDYDYGYVDVTPNLASAWETVAAVENNGFAGKPGPSVDWSDYSNGHRVIDLSDYAGQDIYVRFRVETDVAYSAQDQYNNPPINSVLDGAWQLDNFDLQVGGETVWFDDCEAPGENGWIHHSAPPTGKAGVTFHHLLDPDTFRGFSCGAGSGWMMAAVDTTTGLFVEDQQAVLVSPGIDVSGLDGILVRWRAWVDTPEESRESVHFGCIQSDEGGDPPHEAVPTGGLWVEEWGPAWITFEHDASAWVSKDWIAAVIYGQEHDYYQGGPYTAGLFVDRFRIGTHVGEHPTTLWFARGDWPWDGFISLDDIGHSIPIYDADGVAATHVVASDDGGATWYSRAGEKTYYGERWEFEWPLELSEEPGEVLYYFEVTDSLGNTTCFPRTSPTATMSLRHLPVCGSIEEPCALVVDKGSMVIDGLDGAFDARELDALTAELGILGHEHDLWRLSCFAPPCNGPAWEIAYTHYDTHIWLCGRMADDTLTSQDQDLLDDWLSGSTPEAPRTLILIGDDIAYDLVEEGGDVTGFFAGWLGGDYVDRHPGIYGAVATPDTNIVVRDAGLGIMTYGDGECTLRCGCPDLAFLDVVDALAGAGAQVILEYENGLGETKPAGVARVDSLTGARVALIPFDLDHMVGDGPDGDALNERVDLLGNLLAYLGSIPSGPGTDVDEGDVLATALLAPSPNPFNPTTTIAYTLATPGRVTIHVHDIAGRLVRTLVDEQREPGEHATIWDGTTDTGDRAASGVYFARMTMIESDDAWRGDGAGRRHSAGSVSRQQKLVLLK